MVMSHEVMEISHVLMLISHVCCLHMLMRFHYRLEWGNYPQWLTSLFVTLQLVYTAWYAPLTPGSQPSICNTLLYPTEGEITLDGIVRQLYCQVGRVCCTLVVVLGREDAPWQTGQGIVFHTEKCKVLETLQGTILYCVNLIVEGRKQVKGRCGWKK